jgi:hypothetical protein
MLHWWWRIKKDASQWRGIKKMNSVLVMEMNNISLMGITDLPL